MATNDQRRILIDQIPMDSCPAPAAPAAAGQGDSLIARLMGAGSSNAAAPASRRALIDAAFSGAVDKSTDPAIPGALRDVSGRGLASLAGAPVDIAAAAMAPLGYSDPAPVAGSEWLGRQMEQVGAISPQRRPAAELIANLASPAAMPKAAATGLSLIAAMSPEGKARLLADLVAGKGSGTYRLGDVTEGQAKALQRLGLPKTETRDVMMTDGVFDHLQSGRMARDNYTPADVTKFAEQAMSKSSQAELNSAKAHQNPALVNRKLLDAETGARYDAQMPLKVEQGALTPATVFPRGLLPRNKKPSDE